MNKKLLLLFLANIIESLDAAERTSDLRLHRAAATNNIALLMRAFGRKLNLDRVESNGATPLHYATSANNLFAAQQLLEHGCNPDILDRSRKRAIDLAFGKKSQKLIKLLMQYSDPEIFLEHNKTPLFKSALSRFQRFDQSDFLEALMRNKKFDIQRYIQDARESGNFKAASFMQQWLHQQRQPDRTLIRAHLKRKANDAENQSAAKRQKTAETETLEICFSCQAPVDHTSNPGTAAFTCEHQVHEDCLSSLLASGYGQCQLCQAGLKELEALPAAPSKTAAQLAQEEHDAMIASLLAAGVLELDQLPYMT